MTVSEEVTEVQFDLRGKYGVYSTNQNWFKNATFSEKSNAQFHCYTSWRFGVLYV